mmetsp:Transcript_16543/g.28384  ORF Transcript_16543/g.28384 Transcript_16543/m.28384 type:complete len:208 (+) Transcript_16543:243-866(+)
MVMAVVSNSSNSSSNVNNINGNGKNHRMQLLQGDPRQIGRWSACSQIILLRHCVTRAQGIVSCGCQRRGRKMRMNLRHRTMRKTMKAMTMTRIRSIPPSTAWDCPSLYPLLGVMSPFATILKTRQIRWDGFPSTCCTLLWCMPSRLHLGVRYGLTCFLMMPQWQHRQQAVVLCRRQRVMRMVCHWWHWNARLLHWNSKCLCRAAAAK